MHDISIYFVGGANITINEISESVANKFVDWIEDDNKKETFKIDIPSANKTTCIRKELILFFNVI